MRSSDFVTNSYGESWDSFCEKSGVPVKKHESVIENAILKLKYSPSIGEPLFTFSASLTYAHHYLMKLIK